MSHPSDWHLGVPGASLHPPAAPSISPPPQAQPTAPAVASPTPTSPPVAALTAAVNTPPPAAAAPRPPVGRWQYGRKVTGAWIGLAVISLVVTVAYWQIAFSPVIEAQAPTQATAAPMPAATPADPIALAEPAPLARSTPITDESIAPPAPATTPATDPWARPAGLRRDATVARTTNALASAPDTEAWQTGNQLLASGQWWPAIAAYQRAYAHTPDPALAHNLALALTAAGEHVAAQHWQQRAGEHP